MKPSYRITEVARLYGVNPDTLRYYEEQGLLHPAREDNRYRRYGISEICNISVIRTLRELGIAIERIRQYAADRCCETTLALLDEQEAVIRRKQAQLRRVRDEVKARRNRLIAAQALEVGAVRLLTLPARRGLLLAQDRIPSLEIDYALKKLEQRHADLLRGLGSLCMGARLDPEGFGRGDLTRYSAVFFLGEVLRDCPVLLPAGQYLSVVYAGDYAAFPSHCAALLRAGRERGLEPAGEPVELYHIDAHDTDRIGEYRTEIQIPVQPQGLEESSDFGYNRENS